MTDSSKHRRNPDSVEDRVDESPLCLESDGVVRPILQLSETGFSVPPSQSRAEIEQSQRSEDYQTGLLFTENGEVSIPIQFRVVSTDRRLTSCCWGSLAPDANRALQDLLDFLACDWDEKPSRAVDASDAVSGAEATSPIVDSPATTTLLPATGFGRRSFWRRKVSAGRSFMIRRRHLLVRGIVAILLLNCLLIGYQSLVANKTPVDSTAEAATIGAATSGAVPAELSAQHSAQMSAPSQPAPSRPGTSQPAPPRSTLPQSSHQDTDSPATASASKYTAIIPPSERWVTASERGTVESIAVASGDSVDRGQTVMVTTTGAVNEIDPALAEAIDVAEEKSRQLRNQLSTIDRSASEPAWTASDVESVGDQLRRAIRNRDQSRRRWEQIQPLVQNQNIPRNEVERARTQLSDAEAEVSELRTSWEDLTQRAEPNATIADPAPSQQRPPAALASSLMDFEHEIDRLRQTLARTLESANRKPITTSESGVVVEIPVVIGQRVDFGEPLISIASQQPISLEFMVDSHVAAKFAVNDTARMRIGDGDRIIEGRVTSTIDMAAFDNVRHLETALVPLIVQIESRAVASDSGMAVQLLIPDSDRDAKP
jgi:biotin carboxyl carrier protein/uncharacterized protein Yka (UPF0111/DUF47 family)